MEISEIGLKYPFLQNNLPFWERYISARTNLINSIRSKMSEIKDSDALIKNSFMNKEPLLNTLELYKLFTNITEAINTFAQNMGLEKYTVEDNYSSKLVLAELGELEAEHNFVLLEVHSAICEAIKLNLFGNEPITGWLEAYCPICGSIAAMGIIGDDGKKHLVCGHCQIEWQHIRSLCGICGHTAEEGTSFMSTDELPAWRMELCNSCKFYLKTFDARVGEVITKIYPLFYLTTWELDLAIKDRGYNASLFNIFERASWLTKD